MPNQVDYRTIDARARVDTVPVTVALQSLYHMNSYDSRREFLQPLPASGYASMTMMYKAYVKYIPN
jgi:hypothetical protein